MNGTARQRERGIALILSFLVLMVLTVVVLQLVYTSQVERGLARGFRDGLENTWAARSGVVLAEGLLLEQWDRFDSPEADWMAERAGIEMGEASLSFRIEDEERKFNLRLIVDEDDEKRQWARGVLARLLAVARRNATDADEPSATTMTETILRWAERGDTGTDFKPGGGGLGESSRARRLVSLRELLFLDGFTETLVFGERLTAKEEEKALAERAEEAMEERETDLTDPFETLEEAALAEEEEEKPVPLAEVLTVFGDGRINVNTAPRALLLAMHPAMTEELADAIEDARSTPPETSQGAQAGATPPPGADAGEAPPPGFRNLNALREIEGMVDASKTPPLDIVEDIGSYLKVKSAVFKVRVIVENEQRTQRYEAYLQAMVEEEPEETEGEGEGEGEETGGGGETEGEGEEGEPAEPAPSEPVDEGPVPPSERPPFRVLRLQELD